MTNSCNESRHTNIWHILNLPRCSYCKPLKCRTATKKERIKSMNYNVIFSSNSILFQPFSSINKHLKKDMSNVLMQKQTTVYIYFHLALGVSKEWSLRMLTPQNISKWSLGRAFLKWGTTASIMHYRDTYP